MTPKWTLAVLSGAMLAVALPALAADHGPGGRERPTFADFDANGDGEVTAGEIDAFREGRFAEIDTNGDGQVDRDEFLAHATARAEERAAAMFDRLDSDGDGLLPRDLIALRAGPGADRILDRLDADDSGGISEAEFDRARERREARRDSRGEGGGTHRRHGGGFHGRPN